MTNNNLFKSIVCFFNLSNKIDHKLKKKKTTQKCKYI